MSGRIESCFSKLAKESRAGLAAFVMGGDPDYATSARILEGLPEAGADLIEIGMAFSDPMADGRLIEEAGHRALRAGAHLGATLEMVAQFRKKEKNTPLLLMGYVNPAYHYGVERFAKDAAQAGVDGMILVDLPPEEDSLFRTPLEAEGVHLIRLAAPNSGAERLPKILADAGGFLYYVGITGVTGGASPDLETIGAHMKEIRKRTNLPLALGFGIKAPEDARAASEIADMVVVGSSIVEHLKKTLDKNGKAGAKSVSEVLDFVRALRKGVEEGRRKAYELD